MSATNIVTRAGIEFKPRGLHHCVANPPYTKHYHCPTTHHETEMLKELITKYFDHILYIQIWSEMLRVVDVNSGAEFYQPPYIALEKNSKGKLIVKAVGAEAKNLAGTANIEVTNPFSHPRLLIADFQKAEKILMHTVREVCAKKIFPPSPRVVIHPMEKLEGGLTDIELRVFRELCIGAGAREVVVYVGSPLVAQGFNYEEIKRQGI